MPTNDRQKRIKTLVDRSEDANESAVRRLRASKSLVRFAQYSRRSVAVAKRTANSFILGDDITAEIRQMASALLEEIASSVASKTQTPLLPDVEDVLEGEPDVATIPEMSIRLRPAPTSKPAAEKKSEISPIDRRLLFDLDLVFGVPSFAASETPILATCVAYKEWCRTKVRPEPYLLDGEEIEDPAVLGAHMDRPWSYYRDALVEDSEIVLTKAESVEYDATGVLPRASASTAKPVASAAPIPHRVDDPPFRNGAGEFPEF